MASELQFQELAGILRRQKGLIFAVAVAGAALTSAGALMIPPRYTAKAQIIFDPQYVGRAGEPPPVVSPAEEDSVIPTQVTTLLSQDNMDRVRDSLAKDPDFVAAIGAQAARKATTDAAWRTAADAAWKELGPWLPTSLLPVQPAKPGQAAQAALSPAPRQRPADPSLAEQQVPNHEAFERHLKAFQEVGSHVIAVTYTAASPEVAAAVANRAIQLYIESQSEQKRAATTRELAWLGERLPALKAEVERGEAATQAYQVAHGFTGISPAVATDQQITDLTHQLAAAEADLAARRARLDYVRGLQLSGAGTGAFLEYLNSPALVELHSQELAQVQSETELASSVGERHPKLLQVRGKVRDLRQRISQGVDRAIRNLQNDEQITSALVGGLRQRLDTLQQASTDVRLRDLKHDAAVKQQLYSSLSQRQEELRGQQNVLQPDARILSRASPPDRPSSPNPLLIVFPAMIVFLIGGSMVAVLADRLDRRMRSQRDVKEALGIPCLSLVPKLRRIGRTRPHQNLLAKPLGAYTEAIRSVVASLRLAASRGAPKVILVSSSVPGEGKTTLAVSLATYVASLGRRVLLVDLDFRHSSIQRELGGKAEAGVLDLLLHERKPAEVIQHLADLRLDYLPVSRRRPTDPFALFASDQMRQLLGELREAYDCVIVDGPPLLVITEARLLATMVDKVVLAVKWGSTRREMAQNALNLLRSPDVPDAGHSALVSLAHQHGALDKDLVNIAGAVLTQVDLKKHARRQHGDIAESFRIYRRSYLEIE